MTNLFTPFITNSRFQLDYFHGNERVHEISVARVVPARVEVALLKDAVPLGRVVHGDVAHVDAAQPVPATIQSFGVRYGIDLNTNLH